MFITFEWPESKFQSHCVRVSELLSVLSLLVRQCTFLVLVKKKLNNHESLGAPLHHLVSVEPQVNRLNTCAGHKEILHWDDFQRAQAHIRVSGLGTDLFLVILRAPTNLVPIRQVTQSKSE